MKNSMLENLLKTIADITGEPEGAFNLRKDGVGVMRHSTAVSYTHLTLPTIYSV